MKKMTRIRAGVISMIIMLVVMTFQVNNVHGATTRYDNYADKLSQIGVFVGTGNGFDLDREPTRLEGLIMLIRLLGAEDDAKKMSTASIPFTDVPSWGKGYVAYAYKNGLTDGISKTLFGTNQLMTSNSYLTFVLRALNYNDKKGDFTWAAANDFGLKIGLLSESMYFDVESKDFLRDHVAKISYDALQINVKGGQKTLVESLVTKGAINSTIAGSLFTDTKSPTTTSNLDIDKLLEACVYVEVTGYDGSVSTGSGFFIDGKGTMVTNYHVIQGAKTIKVTTNKDKVYTVNKITGYSVADDLAVIKIDVTGNDYLTMGNSDTLKVSEKIYTIGSPLGLKNTFAEGIVSAIRTDAIQISAPISHGSSGGALINAKGEAVGVTFAGYVEGENLGFVIPIKKVISLSKTNSWTVADVYNRESKFKKPVLTVWSENYTIYLQWTDVGAPIYYLYTSYNGGAFEQRENIDGTYKFKHYDDPYSIIDTDVSKEDAVTYKIVAGDANGNLVESNHVTIQGPGIPDYSEEDVKSYLDDEYMFFMLNDEFLMIDEFTVSKKSDGSGYFINAFLDVDYFQDYLDAEKANATNIRTHLSDYAYEMMTTLGGDIQLTLSYSDVYDSYPSSFVENSIYSKTITTLSDGRWHVFFPLVNVETYKDDPTYYYTFWWGY